MKLTRILALVLAVLLVLPIFAACKKDEEPDVPADTPVDPTPTVEEVVLPLITEGVTEYVIVRDYKAGGEVIDAVNALVSAVKTHTGADITVKECFNDREDPSDVPAEKEILVGMTNREESIDTLSDLRSGDYFLGVVGSKLVVGSTSDSGTMKALTQLINAFIYEQGNRYEVAAGHPQSVNFSNLKNQSSLGTYSYSVCDVANARMDSFVIIYPKESKRSDEFNEFSKQLQSYISKEAGYELDIYKDTRAQGDYEILVGDTIRTDPNVIAAVGPNDYYIKLIPTEKGAQLVIYYGEKAQDDCYRAFRTKFLPSSKTPLELHMDSFCETTVNSLK